MMIVVELHSVVSVMDVVTLHQVKFVMGAINVVTLRVDYVI